MSTAKSIGIAATPDGSGYFLVTTKGSVLNFGDATFFGSAAAKPIGRPITSIAVTTGRSGLLAVGCERHGLRTSATPADGSLAAHSAARTERRRHRSVTSGEMARRSFRSLINVVGYDISNYQCTKPTATTVSKNLPPHGAVDGDRSGRLARQRAQLLSRPRSHLRQVSRRTARRVRHTACTSS